MINPMIDDKYEGIFESIRAIKAKNISFQLKNPTELPEYVMMYYKEQCKSVVLSKLGIILKSVFQIHWDEKEPIYTIYLFGPEPIGEWEAVHKIPSCLLLMPGGDWSTDGILHNGMVSITDNSQLKTKYNYNFDVDSVVSMVKRLSSEAVVRLSYDFEFNREFATGSVRIRGNEAFSKTIIDTFCRNYIDAKYFIKESKIKGPWMPKGSVKILTIENKLDGNREPYYDDLKVGPSNNYLTFHAMYMLNSFGDSANKKSLANILATHYLYGQKNPRQNILCIDNKTILKNISKSLKALQKDDAVEKEGNDFFVKGNIVNGETLPPHEIYATRMRQIRELKQYIKNKWKKNL